MARTHQQTHDAGRHLAVAEALMRGYPAALVGRSSYIEVNGHKVQVQVAAKGAWQIEDVDKYTSAMIERVVLVDLTDGLREFYICPGDPLRSDVRKRYDQYLASKGGTRPRNPASKHSAIYPEQVRKWRNGWRRLA
jgi:ribosome modulation factor